MKLYIADHLGVHKTTTQMEKWFKEKGHEVHWNMYYDPKEAEWCDIAIFEWCEGMVDLAIKDGWAKKKPVFCRAMDIEIWSGQDHNMDLGQLAGLAYTSEYMWGIMREDEAFDPVKLWPNLKTAHIPLSVDMREWKYSERGPGHPIHNVAVIGHFWGSKGEVMIPQFVRYLIDRSGNPNWKFYLQGHWRHDVWRWYFNYMKHIVKELKLENNVFFNEEKVPSINDWMEDKNFLVTYSMKDAFSLIVGEAMAKGIKALPHNFPGSKAIWGKYVWNSFDDLYYKLTNEAYISSEYRTFVNDHYSNDVIMPLWERFIGV